MARTLPASILAALSQDTLHPYFAVDMMFDSGALYIWNGIGDMTKNGNTYIGTGDLLTISDITESTEIAAQGLTLSLSGIPASLLSLALTEPFQGRRCTLYFGDKSAADMVTVFEGRMDTMPFSEQGSGASISLIVEGRLAALMKPVIRRYTSESQKSRFPNDLGCDFINDLSDVKWGGT